MPSEPDPSTGLRELREEFQQLRERLDAVPRILSLLTLGMVLLATSYLYARYCVDTSDDRNDDGGDSRSGGRSLQGESNGSSSR